MNKKVLFGIMSLAALAACTTDDFESQKVAQETGSSVQFEVINNVPTRASMDGNTIKWSAKDGDLFTLYHGGADPYTSNLQNATYTASESEGQAVLTTPSMILAGGAIMVWPADTTFSNGITALNISIPEELKNVENSIPYVSDLIDIKAYDSKAPYNTAGKDRKYPIYMRPMASQLIVKADYAGTDATIAELYDGGSAQPADGGIDEISVTSVDLVSSADAFTTEIPVTFGTSLDATIKAQWDKAVENHGWIKVTELDNTSSELVEKKQLTSKVADNEGCKFLVLPRKISSTGDIKDGAVVVNTNYGKVYVAANGVGDSKYTADEAADAWYRFIKATTSAKTGETAATTPEASGENAGKYKATAAVATGLGLTIDDFTAYTATSGVVKGEPVGAATTRYVKVLLNYLDMNGLHIESDKQLRDAALVWQHIAVEDPTEVTVLLDGNDDEEFEISQNTIKTINEINAEFAETAKPLRFLVAPCNDHKCSTIVITGGGDVQDIPFIVKNGSSKADVALNAGETWNWKGTVKVRKSEVKSVINRGTMQNAETATLATSNNNGTITNVPFVNNGTWNITAGTLTVQFDVTNNGIVNIAQGAQYRQDGKGTATFTNEATTLPERFTGKAEQIGLVNNSGVFATVNNGTINNYGLIEHKVAAAKTYITTNETSGANFANAFNAKSGSEHKMGRINLPFSIRANADNVSVSNSLSTGFVSLTVDGEPEAKTLNTAAVGGKVNYIIVKSGVEKIEAVGDATYLEINQSGELAWAANATAKEYKLAGLIVLSDINIKQNVTVTVSKATYIGDADVYVGGKFTPTKLDGYYGDTKAKEATNIITY